MGYQIAALGTAATAQWYCRPMPGPGLPELVLLLVVVELVELVAMTRRDCQWE